MFLALPSAQCGDRKRRLVGIESKRKMRQHEYPAAFQSADRRSLRVRREQRTSSGPRSSETTVVTVARAG